METKFIDINDVTDEGPPIPSVLVANPDSDSHGLAIALGEAQIGRAQGGIPIGSALLTRAGVRLGAGHNMRAQRGSPTMHAEIAALEDAGRQPASVYRDCTLVRNNFNFHFPPKSMFFFFVNPPYYCIFDPYMYTQYTTLSPYSMCSGAILLYGIPRVVIGENTTFVGEEDLLRSRGVQVVVLGDARCENLMSDFIKEHPEIWYEDIGKQTE
ncbi:cytidine deaminase-like protein [Lactifluus volemus]|nr:cytidine deaminase-like protein [Lactifluus volemus]